MNKIFIIHISVNGYLGCLCFQAIVNRASRNRLSVAEQRVLCVYMTKVVTTLLCHRSNKSC